MTDVYLFQTLDDGDITTERGDIERTAGLETAVYLSLFGGNEADNGSEATRDAQWWGNVGLTDPEQRQVSRTQYLLRNGPPSLASLIPLERAVARDLAWLPKDLALDVSASLPALNRVKLVVTIGAETYEFIEDWATNDRT